MLRLLLTWKTVTLCYPPEDTALQELLDLVEIGWMDSVCCLLAEHRIVYDMNDD